MADHGRITKLETFSTRFIGFVRVTLEDGSTGWGQVSTYNSDITCDVFHRQLAPWVLGQPAFPIDPDPSKVFLVDKAPVYTGLLCEVFRRTADVRRSIHLSSSVCAIGPNAEFAEKLVKIRSPDLWIKGNQQPALVIPIIPQQR